MLQTCLKQQKQQEERHESGRTVAILFDKCPEAFFAMLGTLKAGCAFVALDPGAPPSRKRFILHDSRAAAVLTSQAFRDEAGSFSDVPVLAVDEATLLGWPPEPVDLGRQLSPSSVCYCLYTSGTTGTPKGCEITHDNAVQAVLAFQRLFAGRWDASSSRWLQFASFHFDVAVLEQYWTWCPASAAASSSRAASR
ncbi:hypothetical protein VTK73DRAFT_5205 [Phialemonium thermophilum]|uniref:AMP-dependent synthetase/ligase domain-containing protein n=1 Tax=Phialemonium thermophilum TaxID=223376 RepID=A0ABR3V3B1_9PEZI